MLPEPGLQAEEVDVEISRDLAMGRRFAGVLTGAATGVVETPAHQAHLEEVQTWSERQNHFAHNFFLRS